MNDSSVVEIALRMLTVTGELAAPMLLTAMCIGLAIGPVAVRNLDPGSNAHLRPQDGRRFPFAIVVAGHWMVSTLVGFTDQLFSMIPQLVGS